MKALSVRQPWGYAITHLNKRLENRRWRWLRHGVDSLRKQIGEREWVALHASSARSDDADWDAVQELGELTEFPDEAYIQGAFIGVFRIADVLRAKEPMEIVEPTIALPRPHYAFHEGDALRIMDLVGEASFRPFIKWWTGPHALVLADVLPLTTPLGFKGALGFWQVPNLLGAQIGQQLPQLYR